MRELTNVESEITISVFGVRSGMTNLGGGMGGVSIGRVVFGKISCKDETVGEVLACKDCWQGRNY